MEGLGGRRAGLVRAKASREPPREGWRWAGDWRRSGGLSSLAVAAVSRDTIQSFSPPAATPVTVSVTATLLLGTGGSHGRGRIRAGALAPSSSSGDLLRAGCVPPSLARRGRTAEAAPARSGPVGPFQAGQTPPVGLSGGRATSCGNGRAAVKTLPRTF